MKTNKKCIYCGDYITLNKDEVKMLEEGEINFSSIDCCDYCSNNQNNEENFFAGIDSEF
jgi:hypothetical protein